MFLPHARSSPAPGPLHSCALCLKPSSIPILAWLVPSFNAHNPLCSPRTESLNPHPLSQAPASQTGSLGNRPGPSREWPLRHKHPTCLFQVNQGFPPCRETERRARERERNRKRRTGGEGTRGGGRQKEEEPIATHPPRQHLTRDASQQSEVRVTIGSKCSCPSSSATGRSEQLCQTPTTPDLYKWIPTVVRPHNARTPSTNVWGYVRQLGPPRTQSGSPGTNPALPDSQTPSHTTGDPPCPSEPSSKTSSPARTPATH